MFTVRDKIVLVTGGTRGIGFGIAKAFSEQGAKVFTCGRNVPIDNFPFEFFEGDVREPISAASIISQVTETAGRLDVLINNAGGGPPADAATASPRFTESIIRLNLLAPLLMSQLSYEALRTSHGSIINIASVSAVRSSPGTMAYGAAKAGLLNATLSLAQEWGPDIRVNAIIAGLIKTQASHEHYGGTEGISKLEAKLPAKRMGTPDDIASACLYLASDQAEYVSGASLEVFGGGEPPSFLSLIDEAVQ